jgi:hypothetical protein
MGNNSFAILGIEDSIAFIKYIDSVGNILSEILISKISSNKIINKIDFNYNKTKIILNGLTIDNKGFVSEYNLNGSLIKNIALQGLPNNIRQCAPNSYIMFDLGKILTLGSKWIKVDSNYQIISSYPIKDVSSQGYSVKYVMNISNSFSNFYGIGTYVLGNGFNAKTSLFIKKIDLLNINYIKNISIYGNSSINELSGSILLYINILPTNAAIRDIIWSISDTNLATITQTGLVTAKANGTVIVTATAADGGGAKATKTITISNQNVGINEANLNNQITVYPNPASNMLTIKTFNNLAIQQLFFLDITGKIIAQFNNQTEIDLTNIANGMYLLQIQTENGNLIKQVVVNKQ